MPHPRAGSEERGGSASSATRRGPAAVAPAQPPRKRSAEPAAGRPSKLLAAGGESPQSKPFGVLSREAFLQKRVHPKLRERAALLSDAELAELGLMEFSKQFKGIEVLLGEPEPSAELFGGAGREAYMQQHVHRKLHDRVAGMSDEEILGLGRLSFNEQFTVLLEPAVDTAGRGANPQGHSPDLFGGAGREAFMQQHVHRRLHGKAAALGDQELLALGRLSFNEQFPVLEGAPGPAPPASPQRPSAADLFAGLSREAYMATRVHRRLHAQAAQLSDQQLRELGQLSFNQQFTRLESGGLSVPRQAPVDLFQGLGREGYMQQRVHRKLHARAVALTDEELLELGKLTFNDQFPTLEALGVAATGTVDEQSQSSDVFGGMSREAFMSARVHRRLHPRAAQLSDEELQELGQLSFNQQFTFLEDTPDAQLPSADLFQGLGREGYMQQRVHRRLHPQAAGLSDEELFELGRLTFNEQFPAIEQMAPADTAADELEGSSDIFGGIGREAYMAQRVHRRLHAQAAALSDVELLELGKLSFNQQFPMFEDLPSEQSASADLFSGMGREGYMQQRVHRRLHGKAVALSDQALAELGKLSFNDQFPALEHLS